MLLNIESPYNIWFEERSERSEGEIQANVWGKECSSKEGNNTCKNSEVGTYLLCSRNSEEVRPVMLGQKCVSWK